MEYCYHLEPLCVSVTNNTLAQLDLMLLGNVRWEDSWKDLVLPKGHKSMVQAMVETHAKGTRSTTGNLQDNVEVDLVRGKGALLYEQMRTTKLTDLLQGKDVLSSSTVPQA
jgi:hypothetical protein